MKMQHYKLSAVAAFLLAMSACSQPMVRAQQHAESKPFQQTQQQPTVISQSAVVDQPVALNSQRLQIASLPDFQAEDAAWLQWAAWPQASMVLSSRAHGLLLLDEQKAVLSRIDGTFGSLDYRVTGQQLLLAVMDLKRQQPAFYRFDLSTKQWSAPVFIPKRTFKADGICLFENESQHQFAFLVGEEGIGEQWLVASKGQPLATPLMVRGLSFPPQSEHCTVDDATATLYVNEEEVGVWAYDAHAEADLIRQPVDMRQPFGGIQQAVAGMALLEGYLLALDPEQANLHRYSLQGKNWQAQPQLSLAGIKEPKHISVRATLGKSEQKQLLLVDDDGGLHRADLKWPTSSREAVASLPVIPAAVSSDLVPSVGDAADDPAIWVHATQPTKSRVLATDKQGGLQVFDLQGKALQYLPVGRLNNVDLRSGFMWGKQKIDIAVATNRDHNSLHVFAIQPHSGQVSVLGELPTTLKDIYGICLFKDKQGEIYAIPNSKDGTFIQYRLHGKNQQLSATELRRFTVDSQPEACVADDASEQLFVGEEDRAVWVLDAKPSVVAKLQLVIATADTDNDSANDVISKQWVHADIEGVGFYRGAKHSYLIVSSQGNNSFVVLDATAPYAVRGAFHIGMNVDKGIDAVSETDGLAVTSANLGGAWHKGMLVVQDGRKRMPEGNQNYKYVPWAAIADLFNLP